MSFKSFKDFGKALLDIAKQAVAEIIAQFIKLRVITPLLASLFGGSQTAFAQSLTQQVQGSAMNGIMGNGSNFLSNIFGGGSGLVGDAASGYVYANPAAVGPPTAGSQAFATYAPWAGAAVGALYGWQQGGDTPGKAAGAAAYGSVGYAAASYAALGSIPVVGWIGLAAIAIDKISGGKLFGTDFKTKSTTQAFNFDATGASAAYSAYQEGQKSFFRGKKRRTISLDVDQETLDAIQKFYGSIKESVEAGAKALGVEVPQIVAGSFEIVRDKKGNIKSQVGKILGQTFDETFEQFQQRLLGENILAVLTQFDSETQRIAEDFRGSAEELLAGAQFLAGIANDVKAGFTTLAGDDTLSSVYDFVDEAKQAGESIEQAYQRIVQATAAYRGIVSQIDDAIASFGPQGTEFEQAYQAIFANAKATADQLNEAAKAAGLTAANTEDLTKVQKLAALQAQQIIKQLESTISQQVADLFGTPQQRALDEINQQIDALSKKPFEQQLGFGYFDLIKQRDKLQKEAEEQAAQLEKASKAQALSTNLADFAAVSGLGFDEIANKFGFGLGELADALGFSQQELSDYLAGLEQQATSFIDIQDLITASNALLQSILDAVRGGTPESNGSIGNYGKDYDPLTAAGPKVAGMQVDVQQSADAKLDRIAESLDRLIGIADQGNVINAGGLGEIASGLNVIRRDRGMAENGLPRNAPRYTPTGVR